MGLKISPKKLNSTRLKLNSTRLKLNSTRSKLNSTRLNDDKNWGTVSIATEEAQEENQWHVD